MHPNNPIEETEPEYCPPSNRVGPVRESFIWLGTCRRLCEGHNEEEGIGRAKEGGSEEPNKGHLGPVGVGAEIEVEDSEGNGGVDD